MEIYDISWSNHTSIGWEINLLKKKNINIAIRRFILYMDTTDIMKTWELLETAASTSQEIPYDDSWIHWDDSMPMSVQ